LPVRANLARFVSGAFLDASYAALGSTSPRVRTVKVMHEQRDLTTIPARPTRAGGTVRRWLP
jgi:hypothetical protein